MGVLTERVEEIGVKMSVECVWYVYCDVCCERPKEPSHIKQAAIKTALAEGYTRDVDPVSKTGQWLCSPCTAKRQKERKAAKRLKLAQKLSASSWGNPNARKP